MCKLAHTGGMEVAPEVIELELLAQKAAVPMAKALRHAGVAHTTYWRWRNEGKDPQSSTLRKVRAAITELAG